MNLLINVTDEIVLDSAYKDHNYKLSKGVWVFTSVADKARESRQYNNFDNSNAFISDVTNHVLISGSGIKNLDQVDSHSIIRSDLVETVLPSWASEFNYIGLPSCC